MLHLLDFDVKHINVLEHLENVQIGYSGLEEILSAKEVVFGKSVLIVLDLGIIFSTLMSLPWSHVLHIHGIIEILKSFQCSCLHSNLIIVLLWHILASLDAIQISSKIIFIHRTTVRSESTLNLGLNSW